MIPTFVDWSYYSQVIVPIKTLKVFYKMHFYIFLFNRFLMLYTGLQNGSGFLQIESHMLY